MEPTRGYLHDVETGERFDFQFNPEEVEISLGSTRSSPAPRGASHPRQRWHSGAGRTFTLVLQFIRTTDDGKDVEERARQVEALAFGDYDTSGQLVSGPHVVRVALGAWRSLRCVVDSVKVAYGPVFDPVTLAPFAFVATIAFVEVPESGDVSRAQVLRGA